jgi:hypothetical protein
MTSRYGSQALAEGLRVFRYSSIGGRLHAKAGGHPYGRFCRNGIPGRSSRRFFRRRVGDHLYGRFWIMPAPAAGRPQRHARRLQVSRCGLAPNSRSALDAAQRPSQPTQCYDLLFLFFVQELFKTLLTPTEAMPAV